MYQLNYVVDLIQNAKKEFNKTFVTNEAIKASLDAYVDAQTTFVKQILSTADVVTKESAGVAKDVVEKFKV